MGQTLPGPLRGPSKKKDCQEERVSLSGMSQPRDTTLSWGALQGEFDGEETVSVFLIWAFALF